MKLTSLLVFLMLYSSCFAQERDTVIRYNVPQTNFFSGENKSYAQGYSDASVYYKGYENPGTTTLLVSLFLSPFTGVLTAANYANKAPKDKDLTPPDVKLMENNLYRLGYQDKAFKMKKQKVWKNFGIGVSINVALVFGLIVLS